MGEYGAAGRGGWYGATAESEPGAITPSRRCRTPPYTFAKAAVDEGGKGSAYISFEKNDAAFNLLFVIAGLVPAIHRGANVICDRARRARFALHSCSTMDRRNKSGNDSIGGI
jgi:hypothetical protein